MKNVHAKSRKLFRITASFLFTMVAGPAVVSLGLDSAVAQVMPQLGDSSGRVAYHVSVVMASGQKDAASGSMKVEDGSIADIWLGALAIRVKCQKSQRNWLFNIEARDTEKDKLVLNPSILTTGMESAELTIHGKDDASGGEFKEFSFTLSPSAAPQDLYFDTPLETLNAYDTFLFF